MQTSIRVRLIDFKGKILASAKNIVKLKKKMRSHAHTIVVNNTCAFAI
jgi:hypothetical protein